MKSKPGNSPSKPAASKSPSTPRYHPSTGQIISPVEGDSPYVPKGRARKASRGRPRVTIAPSSGNGPDVRITRGR
jgi:hypothetical protein